MTLALRNVHKSYRSHHAVRGLSMFIARGSISCLLGPRGSGKPTAWWFFAGLESVEQSEILINSSLVSAPGTVVSPEKRRIGMVFQEYALFPHLGVAANIAFGLHRIPKAERDLRVAELVEAVGLGGFESKFPHELSGGQQQRVALARALAPRPHLLLLDEPFSNLDVDLRERLSLEVRDIIKANGTTAVLVTHDQHEAFAMADEIGVMHEGRIVQWDSAYNLYHKPVNRFVADFVGQGVFLPASVLNSRQVEIELGVLDGDIPHDCLQGCAACGRGCSAEVLLRPDDVVHDDASATLAEVVHKAFRGAEILYTLRLDSGRKVLAMVPSHHNHALGERIGIRLDVDHVVAFSPRDSEAHYHAPG